MAFKLPPSPVGVPPGHSFWNDWYEKLRAIINGISALSWDVLDFNGSDLADIQTRDHGVLQGLSDDDHTQYQLRSEKNNASGYAGLNSSSRTTKGVDASDDLIVDSSSKGLVLKSPNGHYWRATISNAGVVTWTDLGTTKP